MSTSIGRGAQNMHTVYIKPALRKAYHRKTGSSSSSDTSTRLNQQQHDHEAANYNKKKCVNINNGSSVSPVPPADTTDVWVPDNRTGIYYPKGQEKVIEDVPSHAAKDYNVNWFSIP